jgi:hypothetical protein
MSRYLSLALPKDFFFIFIKNVLLFFLKVAQVNGAEEDNDVELVEEDDLEELTELNLMQMEY